MTADKQGSSAVERRAAPNPAAMLADILSTLRVVARYRRLTLELARRDISDRYAGQVLGSVWALVHPIATISVFLFLFGVVFATKAAAIGWQVPSDHAVYLVSGIVTWLVATDVLARGPGIVTGQAALVKQVVFPLEVLPVKTVLATTPIMCIGLIGLTLYTLVTFHTLSAAYLLLPFCLVLLYVFLFGVAFLLSALGVFLADLRDIVQLYLLIGLYLAPVFYFMSWVPEKLRPILYLNPMTLYVECFHDAAYFGGIRDGGLWLAAAGVSALVFMAGALIFNRLKPQFGSFL